MSMSDKVMLLDVVPHPATDSIVISQRSFMGGTRWPRIATAIETTIKSLDDTSSTPVVATIRHKHGGKQWWVGLAPGLNLDATLGMLVTRLEMALGDWDVEVNAPGEDEPEASGPHPPDPEPKPKEDPEKDVHKINRLAQQHRELVKAKMELKRAKEAVARAQAEVAKTEAELGLDE
jgi:hypothetical protein